jgi:cyclase
VGDPINAVKIFNDKEVDELVFLDIAATVEKRGPNFEVLREITNEAFMPLAYGGGVRTPQDVERIVQLGVEKVVVNSKAAAERSFIRAAADLVGGQSVVISIDVKKRLFGGYEVYSRSGTHAIGLDPICYAVEAVAAGAGEIILNSIDRDGTQQGYDVTLLKRVTAAVDVPVIALGGAGSVQDFALAIREGGAAAVAAGSLFVFHGKHRAVLITYPERGLLESLLSRERMPACRQSAAVA